MVKVGVVSVAQPRSVPPENGATGLECKQSGRGVEVAKVSDRCRAKNAVKAGDVIVEVNGTAISDMEAYKGAAEGKDRIAGEKLDLTVLRNGDKVRVSLPLTFGPTDSKENVLGGVGTFELEGSLSYLRSGFPAVFEHDTVLQREDCGGPVTNLSGEIVGVNIARARRHASYAVPTRVILEVLNELKKGEKLP